MSISDEIFKNQMDDMFYHLGDDGYGDLREEEIRLEELLKSGAKMQCLVDDKNSKTGSAWHNCKYLADTGDSLMVELTSGFAEYCRTNIPKTHIHLELREQILTGE